MNHYFITISYDGNMYHGWQRLPNQKNTIQETLETTLSIYLNEIVKINGSGRTDAGVSAISQTADFFCKSNINNELFLNTINKSLPDNIKITSVKKINPADEPFHARKSAKKKHYRYSIALTQKSNPFTCKYIYNPKETPLKLSNSFYNKTSSTYEYIPSQFNILNINMQNMQKAAEMLCGSHDFSAFTTDKDKEKNHVRTIYKIKISIESGTFPTLHIDYYGNGFLYNMVRILSGTLLYCGLNKFKAAQIPEILSKKERKLAGPTLPSNGLTLMSVSY